MSYAQYLRQLLAPLGIYQLNAPFQGGELEALGDAFDQVEGALEELLNQLKNLFSLKKLQRQRPRTQKKRSSRKLQQKNRRQRLRQ